MEKEIYEIVIKGIDYSNKNTKKILYTINENGCWECFSHAKSGGRNRKENNDDKVSKNRQLKGSDVGNSILKPEQILSIVDMCNQGIIEKDIAKIFNVSRGTIQAIKRGKIWSHLTNIKYNKDVFNNRRAIYQPNEVGVKWANSKQRWIVVLKNKHIGTFKTLEEAVSAKYEHINKDKEELQNV